MRARPTTSCQIASALERSVTARCTGPSVVVSGRMGLARTFVWTEVSIIAASMGLTICPRDRPNGVPQKVDDAEGIVRRSAPVSETGPRRDIGPFGHQLVPGPQPAGDLVPLPVLVQPDKNHVPPGLFGPTHIPAPAACVIETVVGATRIGRAGLAGNLPAIGKPRVFEKAACPSHGMR